MGKTLCSLVTTSAAISTTATTATTATAATATSGKVAGSLNLGSAGCTWPIKILVLHGNSRLLLPFRLLIRPHSSQTLIAEAPVVAGWALGVLPDYAAQIINVLDILGIDGAVLLEHFFHDISRRAPGLVVP